MKKSIIIAIIAIVCLTIILVTIYFLQPLKIIETSPKKNEKNIGIDTTIETVFNKKVSSGDFSVIIEPIQSFVIKDDNKKLIINFSENLETNQVYTLTLYCKKGFINPDGEKVNQYTWEFNTGQGSFEQIYDTDMSDFYKKYPLAEFIPYDSEHFSIEGPDENDTYTVILYAIFNAGVNGPPIAEQEKTYHEELKTYKQEALDWIKNKGIDPNALKIKWIPEEAKNH